MKIKLLMIGVFSYPLMVFGQQFECSGIEEEPVIQSQICSVGSIDYLNKYKQIDNYLLNNTTSVKTLKVAMHIWLGSNGEGNWVENQDTYDAFYNIIEPGINARYTNVAASTESFSPILSDPDSRIRIEITGVYFYYDDGTFGSESRPTLLNYIAANHPDRLTSMPIHFVFGNCGGAAGSSNGTQYQNDNHTTAIVSCANILQGPWAMINHLAHEIGHCVDLRHTYDGSCNGVSGDPNDSCCPETDDPQSDEYIDDIFDFGNNWCNSPAGFCYECTGWSCDPTDPTLNCSNNLMGAANLPEYYISPQQMAKMHRAAHIKSIRKYMWGYDDDKLEITDDETWDFSFKTYNDIVIKPGVTLTVTCEIQFVPQARLIIEQGGKLILDGGKLTNAKYSDELWRGIEVWGNSDMSQNQANQGYVIAKNDAIIENARYGIRTIKDDNGTLDYTNTGGVISCRNTTFRNNWMDIEYLPYHSYSPNNSSFEYNNKGRFDRCKFILDDNYQDNWVAPKVVMYDVNGVTFLGCEFNDTRIAPGAELTRTKGIVSLDAGYRVMGKNTAGPNNNFPSANQDEYYDETNYIVGSFKNLLYGVHAMSTTGLDAVIVDHCLFENDKNGILIDGIDNALITRNKFDWNVNHMDDIAGMAQNNFRNSSLQTVEGNLHYRSATGKVSGTSNFDTGTKDTRIYKNKYNNMNVGNYANGFNSNDQSSVDFATGLYWECNEHEGGNLDIYNYIGSYSPMLDGEGAKLLQGYVDHGTGNTFSTNITNGPPFNDWHFNHVDQDNMGYYDITSILPTETSGQIFPTPIDDIYGNSCPSTFTNALHINKNRVIPDKPGKIARVAEIDNERTIKKNELDALMAVGDDPSLHSLVNQLTIQNRVAVKNELLQKSPYLSMSLLEELGQKDPNLFPHSWYKDIVLANIENARKNNFIEFLETKNNPLPVNMIAEIKGNRFKTLTQRGEKELALLRLDSEKDQILSWLIIDELSDSTQTELGLISSYLEDRNSVSVDAEMADYYIKKGDIQAHETILNNISNNLTNYEMQRTQQEMEDFVMFKELVMDITDNTGRFTQELTPAQVNQLEYVADNFIGRSSRQARNILCFFNGDCEDIVIELPEGGPGNSGNKTLSGNNESVIDLSIVPNPNDGKFIVSTSNGCDIAIVNVVDVTGKTIEFSSNDTKEGKVIELINKESGIYLISIQCIDGSIHSSRIVLKK